MRYGRSVEAGFLPVFSTDTEEQARSLIVLACKRGDDGNYYAPDLLQEQTLENLSAFSDRLARAWEFMHKTPAPAEPRPERTRKK